MRLDKYLKVSRILKRRTISKELALNNRVSINNKPAKPSAEVRINDEIEIIFGRRHLTVRVLSIEQIMKKNEATTMYEVIDEKVDEEE
jgi:Ribosome-associated heat shock protein implicated in the recycling of the 50S subunit (S4 paralog)